MDNNINSIDFPIHGFAKTTLLDYPKNVASTVFTGGCNYRCPFCHNKDLVLNPQDVPTFSMDTVFNYFVKRKNILDGVCITGGEPTLQKDLIPFIKKIKSLNLKVKLDTNGSNPSILQELIDNDLIDYVAMDIKNSKEKYGITTGLSNFNISAVEESASILLNSHIPYEFRTTVVKELHDFEDFPAIGEWLRGARSYYLQCYKDSDNVIKREFSAYTYMDMLKIKDILLPYFELVEIRGIDE